MLKRVPELKQIYEAPAQNSIPSKIRAFKLDDLFALNCLSLAGYVNLAQRGHRAKIIEFCFESDFCAGASREKKFFQT
ncbi:MAG: hypothetical protein AAF443_08650 [Chlamydiota bacterium]